MFRFPVIRPLVAALTGLCFLVATLGVIPTPAGIAAWWGRLSTERYPCEACGCGCASARQCWTSCCCHSEVERLAWAIRSGVKPPADLVFSDDTYIAAANLVKAGSAHCSLCVTLVKDALDRGVAVEPDVKTPSCCRTPGSSNCAGAACPQGDESASIKTASGRPGPKPAPGQRTMSGLGCRGLPGVLSVAIIPAIPVPLTTLLLRPIITARLALMDARADSLSLSPSDPPPRA